MPLLQKLTEKTPSSQQQHRRRTKWRLRRMFPQSQQRHQLLLHRVTVALALGRNTVLVTLHFGAAGSKQTKERREKRKAHCYPSAPPTHPRGPLTHVVKHLDSVAQIAGLLERSASALGQPWRRLLQGYQYGRCSSATAGATPTLLSLARSPVRFGGSSAHGLQCWRFWNCRCTGQHRSSNRTHGLTLMPSKQ